MNTSITNFTSLCLKTIGLIIIISSIIDMIALAIPFDVLAAEWQISFTTQVVDRGIVPLVGIAFLLVGYWISATVSNTTTTNTTKSVFPDLRLGVFLLATVLGLLFLFLVPIHLNNLRTASNNVLEQINTGAAETEAQIQARYDQLNTIAQNPQQLEALENRLAQIEQAIATGQAGDTQLNAQQLAQLQNTRAELVQFRDLARDPEALEQTITQLQTQLREQKLERENRTRIEAAKQGIRVGLNSLLLAIAYIIISWFGLKGLGKSGSKPKKRKVSPPPRQS